MGAVAGAEPAAVVAGLADGDTSEMRADACSRGWLVMFISGSDGSGPAKKICADGGGTPRPGSDRVFGIGDGAGLISTGCHVPNITSHLGSLTRSLSVSGSRREVASILLASSISAWVR